MKFRNADLPVEVKKAMVVGAEVFETGYGQRLHSPELFFTTGFIEVAGGSLPVAVTSAGAFYVVAVKAAGKAESGFTLYGHRLEDSTLRALERVLPWPIDGFEAFLRGGDSFTLGKPISATITGDRASDYERQIVSSVDGGPLEVWRGRTGFFVCPEELVHQLPSGLNMIRGVEWTRADPQPYWVTGSVAKALVEARSLVEARGPDGAWLKFRPVDEGRTDPAVALAQLAQANATFAAVLVEMAGVKPARRPPEPVDGVKGLPAGLRKLLEDLP